MPSQKILEKKQQEVENYTQKLKDAKSFILSDYIGINVSEADDLRNKLREANIEYKVVKNSILRFAAKNNEMEALLPHLEGPTSVAISYDDAVAPAKILHEYAKNVEAFDLKCGYVEGKPVDVAEIESLANIPSREVLVAKVLGGLNAPITGFVNVLNGNIRGLACALQAIADKKQQEANA